MKANCSPPKHHASERRILPQQQGEHGGDEGWDEDASGFVEKIREEHLVNPRTSLEKEPSKIFEQKTKKPWAKKQVNSRKPLEDPQKHVENPRTNVALFMFQFSMADK